MVLAQLAELAALWEPGDLRWERFVQRDEDGGLRFYVDGCCVRVHFVSDARYLVVREIGRVLVHLPPGRPEFEANLLGLLGEQ
jgi:hypothetical protein